MGMTSPSGRSRLAFSRFCWAVLVYTIGVILWGAFVRATGSGAGCGSHWPLCDGQVVPRSPDAEMLIEFTHRATSGVAFLLVVVMTVWAYRRFSTGSPVRRAAAASLFFMVVEALLGAALVIFGLVGDDDSLARAWVMAFHLVNTFLLLGAISLTALRGQAVILVAILPEPGQFDKIVRDVCANLKLKNPPYSLSEPEPFRIGGTPAIRVSYQVSRDNIPVVVFFVFFHNANRLFQVMCSCPVDLLDENKADFERVIASLALD